MRRFSSRFRILFLAFLLFFDITRPAMAAPEGTLTWGLHVTLASRWLDPAETEALITPFMVLYAIHDALVKPMPAGNNTPSLAESWTVSKDGLTYEFVLRKGVTFHNGDLVTAEDVKFSFDRYHGASAKLLKDRVREVQIVDPAPASRSRIVGSMATLNWSRKSRPRSPSAKPSSNVSKATTAGTRARCPAASRCTGKYDTSTLPVTPRIVPRATGRNRSIPAALSSCGFTTLTSAPVSRTSRAVVRPFSVTVTMMGPDPGSSSFFVIMGSVPSLRSPSDVGAS
jgi:hypothetical protein